MYSLGNRIQIINAPAGAKYVSQFMETLPSGILNKVETGCGATSLMLENPENVVVCCPTKQMINSKVSQYPNERSSYNILGVQKGVMADDIVNYVNKHKDSQPIKIMVTYDSFPRVASALEEAGISDYRIVVDEYQEILNASIYRNEAIKDLLSALKDKQNVTYMSATPIPYNYKPVELENLPEYEIVWENSVKVKPNRLEVDRPFGAVVNMIKKHQAGNPIEFNGHKVEEYFIFVNSVSGIDRIIKKAKLKKEDVKVICADTTDNQRKLGDIPISNISEPNKTFNFCTKTVFSGADFYSKSGLIVIVSDSWIKSSQLDIFTDIQQISGRIRNEENPFKNLILHIYSIGSTPEEEYKTELKRRLDDAHRKIDAFNDLKKELQGVIIESIKTSEAGELAYYDKENDRVIIDNLKVAYYNYRYDVIESVYSTGISIKEAYKQAGFDVESSEEWIEKIKTNVFMGFRENKFERLYKTYSEERVKTRLGKTEIAKEIEMLEDIVPMAYSYLGDERVAELKYEEDDIRKWTHFKMPATQEALKQALRMSFGEGQEYLLDEVKTKLKLIFDSLSIELTPKAVMLEKEFSEYFTIRKKKVRLTSGRRKDGYEIISVCMLAISGQH